MTPLLHYHLLPHIMHLINAFGDGSSEVNLAWGCAWVTLWHSSRSWTSRLFSSQVLYSWTHHWIVFVVKITIFVDMQILIPLHVFVLGDYERVLIILTVFQAIGVVCFHVCLRPVYICYRMHWTMFSLLLSWNNQKVVWHLLVKAWSVNWRLFDHRYDLDLSFLVFTNVIVTLILFFRWLDISDVIKKPQLISNVHFCSVYLVWAIVPPWCLASKYPPLLLLL